MFKHLVVIGLFIILIFFNSGYAQTTKTFGIGIAILDL